MPVKRVGKTGASPTKVIAKPRATTLAAKKPVAKKTTGKKVRDTPRDPVGQAVTPQSGHTDQLKPKRELTPARVAGIAARLRTIATTAVGAKKSKPASSNEQDSGDTLAESRPARTRARRPATKPRPQRRSAVDRIGDLPPGAPLADRVVKAIDHELTQIEAIIGRSRVKPAERSEGERRARTLALLARTLSELKKLRSAEDTARPADDDAASGDIAAFRLDLARRLDVLVDIAKAVHPGSPDDEGDR